MYSQPETTREPFEISKNMQMESVASRALRFASVRLEFQEDGKIERIINGSSDCHMPPPSPILERLIAEKIALLKLAPIGKILKKVGRRHSDTVYYIRIFPEDMARMEKLFIRGELHEV